MANHRNSTEVLFFILIMPAVNVCICMILSALPLHVSDGYKTPVRSVNHTKGSSLFLEIHFIIGHLCSAHLTKLDKRKENAQSISGTCSWTCCLIFSLSITYSNKKLCIKKFQTQHCFMNKDPPSLSICEEKQLKAKKVMAAK